MFFVNLFVTLIYQPFLNILVFFYWIDNFISRGHPDMGIAVIMLTVVIRIILLPLSLMEDKNEKTRREFEEELEKIKEKYKADPLQERQETKKLFKKNSTVVTGEIISFFVQAAIALMLWKMFDTGLPGQDIPLIYSFMPKVTLPFNLLFLGKYDLSHSNFTLNLIQSLMIFIVETASVLTSPYPVKQGDVIRLQLILPLVSFFIFLALPAGKKVFVITTLLISLLITIYKFIRRKFREYSQNIAKKEKAAEEAKKEEEEKEQLRRQVQLLQQIQATTPGGAGNPAASGGSISGQASFSSGASDEKVLVDVK